MPRRSREVLRDEYLRWLEPQLRDEHDGRDKTFWTLANVMFDKEFLKDIPVFLPMDENRMVDGLDLRVEWARAHGKRPHILDVLGECSFLEVLIGLSRRLSFTAGGSAPGWAWHLLCNLELNRMSDPITPAKVRRAQKIMDTVIWRTYNPDGTGGFFPLAWPDTDLTKVELWYQLNAYVAELHPEH